MMSKGRSIVSAESDRRAKVAVYKRLSKEVIDMQTIVTMKRIAEIGRTQVFVASLDTDCCASDARGISCFQR